jgi:tetratricopeptide (TPR) repeat protein/predicted aspartyl protease
MIAGLGLSASASPVLAACALKPLFQAPVTLVGGHPTVSVQLNGQGLGFTLDSGASYSAIDQATARALKLPLVMAPGNMVVTGVGGTAVPQVTTVRAVTIAGAAFSNMQFLVQPQSGMNVLGQNLLGYADAEYDLPHAAIRLMQAQGCGGDNLAYWAGPGQAVSVVNLDWSTRDRVDRTAGLVTVNGQKIRAVFDTGAQGSVLSLAAAARAGIKPDSPGVVPSGAIYGVGDRTVKLWTATFGSVMIGDEEIKNVRLQFGDLRLNDADMLVGDDFFLSHRVYVANSQHKLYITYEGGPVFDLAAKTLVQDAAGQAPHAPTAPAAGAEPADAEGYARRASVYLTQRDYDHGIADLGRAMALAPGNANYAYERANAHLAAKQPALAMADLDQTLKLQPRAVPALLLRARLRLSERDTAGAVADIDAASAVIVTPQDDARLALGEGYRTAGRHDQALGQYDQWISAHPDDGRLAEALFGRCRSRAILGRELDRALADCNRAAGLAPKAAGVLETRGMVRFKTGDYARAVTDYDAALEAQPKDAMAMYGRGLAKLKLGRTAEGQSDLSAASTLQPKIVEQAKASGLASD